MQRTSHAAEPKNGLSPAIARIIQKLNGLPSVDGLFQQISLLTIIHLRMGEMSFGIAPGYAEIMLTLRAFNDQ